MGGEGSDNEEGASESAAAHHLQSELEENEKILRYKRIADHAAHADEIYVKALSGGDSGVPSESAFGGEDGVEGWGGEEEEDSSALPQEGLTVDYCIFCYHGTGILRHDNVALLTKFVSERGTILPKRFTK